MYFVISVTKKDFFIVDSLLNTLTVSVKCDGATLHGGHLDVWYQVLKFIIVLQTFQFYKKTKQDSPISINVSTSLIEIQIFICNLPLLLLFMREW